MCTHLLKYFFSFCNTKFFFSISNILGVKKLKEDERRSIRILEQSFFVNEKAAIDDEIKMDPEGSHMGSHFCEECEISFDITSHFARHLYAHTFIKIEEDDMPCICADCGFDFIGKMK